MSKGSGRSPCCGGPSGLFAMEAHAGVLSLDWTIDAKDTRGFPSLINIRRLVVLSLFVASVLVWVEFFLIGGGRALSLVDL